MKKILYIIIGILAVLVLATIVYFTFFIKDESGQAQIPNEINPSDENFENSQKNIVDKIISNPPQLEGQANIEAGNLASQSGENNIQTQSVKSGTFNKIDPLHYASGNVSVEKFGENYKLVFQDNFASADGPDLYVYLSEPQNFKNIAIGGLDTKKTINLGVLKNMSGQQEYIVSKSDFEKYNGAVVIWCKQFGIQFSRADLK